MVRLSVLAAVAAAALLAPGCVQSPPPPPPPTPCAVGTYSATGAAPCTPAPVGTYVDTQAATQATACQPGTFQDQEGQASCIPAPAGRFVAAPGAAAAELCPLGRFQSLSGQTSCALAPIGTYVDIQGATEPTDCPTGTTTANVGSASASDCFERILAVAFSNLDGISGYDPDSGDVLIAKLVDTNGDGQVSVGDEVVTDRYPLDFDATAFGHFQTTSHTVTAVDQSQATSILVRKATGSFFYWELNPGPNAGRYIESDPSGSFRLVLGEQTGPSFDFIRAFSDAPSAPDVAIDVSRASTTDDPFFEVELRN